LRPRLGQRDSAPPRPARRRPRTAPRPGAGRPRRLLRAVGRQPAAGLGAAAALLPRQGSHARRTTLTHPSPARPAPDLPPPPRRGLPTPLHVAARAAAGPARRRAGAAGPPPPPPRPGVGSALPVRGHFPPAAWPKIGRRGSFFPLVRAPK